ncbi:hypothetical protein [Kordiimonas sp.]|uniref:hypothetical protein n=1 Tax=Kordiimonas sp. TaxID=1970157 RepID=UPI003A90FD31
MQKFHDVMLPRDESQFGLKKGATGAIIGVNKLRKRVYTVEFPQVGTAASTLLDLDADIFDLTGDTVVVAGWRQAQGALAR